MQAIILAAGKGTRMGELTKSTPKPMLTIEDKTLLEWKINNLPQEVDEVIIVVGYLKEKVREFFGSHFNGKKITYVEAEPRGTGYAVWQCKEVLKDRFVVLMGDDLYSREAIAKACTFSLSITVKQFATPRRGCIKQTAEGNFDGIDDGIASIGAINTGLYSLNKSVFDFDLVQVPGSAEWGLPHTLVEVSKKHPVKVIETNAWYQVTAPGDLNPTEDILAQFR